MTWQKKKLEINNLVILNLCKSLENYINRYIGIKKISPVVKILNYFKSFQPKDFEVKFYI